MLMPFVSSILPNCVERDRNLSYPHRQRPELCPWVRTLQSPSDAGTVKVNDSRAPDAGAEPARSSPEQLADKVFGNRSRHGTILRALCRIAKKRFFAEQSLISDDYQTLLRIVVPRAARHTTCRRMPIDYVPASAFRPCLCRPISVRERCKSRKTVRRVRLRIRGTIMRSCPECVKLAFRGCL